MRTSGRSQQSSGYVVTVAVLIVLAFGLTLWVAWQQRQAAELRVLARRLQARLNQELAQEMRRLESVRATVPGGSMSSAEQQANLIQALENLLERARGEQLTLERQQFRLKALSGSSATEIERRRARIQLLRLTSRLRIARLWVRMVEAQLLDEFRQREARARSRAPPAVRQPPPSRPAVLAPLPEPIPPPK